MAGPAIAVQLRVSAADVWDLLTDSIAQEHWLCQRGHLRPNAGAPLLVYDSSGTRYRGSVLDVQPRRSLRVSLTNPATETATPTRDVYELRITQTSKHNTRLELERLQGGADPDATLEFLWRPALRRLQQLVDEVRRRRRPRQAVVVIHGIGEQKPGETVADLLEALAGDEAPVFSKPDQFSKSFELRRLTLAGDDRRPTTDFFEYYWAHHISGTSIGDVLSWVGSIVMRRPWHIPPHLRVIFWLFWLVVAGVVASALLVGSGASAFISRFSVVITVVLGIINGAVVRSLGDAARYLSPRPGNIEARQRIRQGGVELLEELHRSGKYHRIIVLGHSLGSIIAYDVLTYLWPRMSHLHDNPDQASFTSLARAEARPQPGQTAEEAEAAVAAEFPDPHRRQSAVWREMRRNTQPWLVTDFVSLGSPLAHAELLMVARPGDLPVRQTRRELPTAPPAKEESGRFSYPESYLSRTGEERTFDQVHHAGVFAAVRWTNLFFPARLGIFGDAVGGEIAPIFGRWVCDIPLRPPLPAWRRHTLKAHSSYWRPLSPRGRARLGKLIERQREEAGSKTGEVALQTWCERTRTIFDHIIVLRAAIDLNRRRDLESQALKHSPLMYLGKGPWTAR